MGSLDIPGSHMLLTFYKQAAIPERREGFLSPHVRTTITAPSFGMCSVVHLEDTVFLLCMPHGVEL